MRLPRSEWPTNWNVELLGKLCDIQIGKTPPRDNSNYWGGHHVWVSIADMQGRIVSSSKEQITDLAIKNGHARLVRAGTLLMSFKLTIGKLAFAGCDLFTNEAIAALSIRDEFKDKLSDEFLYFALQAIPLEQGATFAVKGRTLNKKTMQVIPVPFPDINTQRRIVARIEALLTEVREMRALQADIENSTNRLMDTVLADVFSSAEIATWSNIEPLGNLIEITAPMVNPTLPEYGSLPHIYGATIEEGTGRLLDYNTAAEDGMTSSKYHFQPGAVLYSKIRPYLRKATIVDFEGVCSADMYPLQLKNGALTAEFLLWSLLSPRFTDYANNLSGRARMPKLNRSQLFDYQIPYPSHEAQKRISAKLFAVRDEIYEMRKSNQDNFERINQLEQVILAQAFRGEL